MFVLDTAVIFTIVIVMIIMKKFTIYFGAVRYPLLSTMPTDFLAALV